MFSKGHIEDIITLTPQHTMFLFHWICVWLSDRLVVSYIVLFLLILYFLCFQFTSVPEINGTSENDDKTNEVVKLVYCTCAKTFQSGEQQNVMCPVVNPTSTNPKGNPQQLCLTRYFTCNFLIDFFHQYPSAVHGGMRCWCKPTQDFM